jgi:hypothetical protein
VLCSDTDRGGRNTEYVSMHWVQSAGRRLLLLGIQCSPKQTGATWIQARIPFTTESSVLACVDVSLVFSKFLPLRQSPFLSTQRRPQRIIALASKALACYSQISPDTRTLGPALSRRILRGRPDRTTVSLLSPEPPRSVAVSLQESFGISARNIWSS